MTQFHEIYPHNAYACFLFILLPPISYNFNQFWLWRILMPTISRLDYKERAPDDIIYRLWIVYIVYMYV